MSDGMEGLRDALVESYKHRLVDGAACSTCATVSRPLAMQMIRYAQSDSAPLPSRFVPLSASFGTVRGCFPVCDSCAPPCSKCQLPIPTAAVKNHFKWLHGQLHSEDSPVLWGNGKCLHVHLFGVWPL